MGIQDLGAIGEFISSIVILITLVVLAYEVRTAKQATQVANVQERHRARDFTWAMPVEAPHLAEIVAKASNHLGYRRLEEEARDFGLEPHEMGMLGNYFMLVLAHWADWLDLDLPDRERELLEINIKNRLNQPVFMKWFDRISGEIRVPEHPMNGVFLLIDDLRASAMAD